MTEQDWYSRYSRQLLVEGMNEEVQHRLGQATVAIAGLGGLGCTAAAYLAGAGVGNLVLIDADTISISNLPRQLLYTQADIGQPKVIIAAQRLQANNPHCRVLALPEPAQALAAGPSLSATDVLLDCTDNVAARLHLSTRARAAGKPLVSAAASGTSAQMIAFHPGAGHSCYGCLDALAAHAPATCLQQGILGPVVGLAGTYQALLTLHILTGLAPVSWGVLLRFCGLTLRWQESVLPPAPTCSVCKES